MGDIRIRNQNTQPHTPFVFAPDASLRWPIRKNLGRRSEVLKLQDLGSRTLPALTCVQWEHTANPEFNTLILQPHAASRSLARRWVQKFQWLGHTHDLLVVGPELRVQLYRPVCTDSGKDYLCFHYLYHPAD